MYEPEYLAEKIKTCAKQRGITLKTVFEKCGLGKNTLGNLTAGRSIAYDSLALIADEIGCSLDFLLDRNVQGSEAPMPKDELLLLRRYRSLDDDGKEMVLSAALGQMQRMMAQGGERQQREHGPIKLPEDESK